MNEVTSSTRDAFRRRLRGKEVGATLREVEFELAGSLGDAVLGVLAGDPSVEATTHTIHVDDAFLWIGWSVRGPPAALARLSAALPVAPSGVIEGVDAVRDRDGSLLVAARIGRGGPSDASAESYLAFLAASLPVSRVRVAAGRIAVQLLARPDDELLRIYEAARAAAPAALALRVLRAGPSRPPTSAMRRPLRSDEVRLLAIALERGYYDDPKRCGVRELGDALGFSKSVVARKLRNLERLALEQLQNPV